MHSEAAANCQAARREKGEEEEDGSKIPTIPCGKAYISGVCAHEITGKGLLGQLKICRKPLFFISSAVSQWFCGGEWLLYIII